VDYPPSVCRPAEFCIRVRLHRLLKTLHETLFCIRVRLQPCRKTLKIELGFGPLHKVYGEGKFDVALLPFVEGKAEK